MKTRLIYSKEEQKFYSVPDYTSEEIAKMEELGEQQLKNGEFGLILDSPEAINKFKEEVGKRYGVYC